MTMACIQNSHYLHIILLPHPIQIHYDVLLALKISRTRPLVRLIMQMPQHRICHCVDVVRLITHEILLVSQKVGHGIHICFVNLQHSLMAPSTHPLTVEASQDAHTEGVKDFAEFWADFCSGDLQD